MQIKQIITVALLSAPALAFAQQKRDNTTAVVPLVNKNVVIGSAKEVRDTSLVNKDIISPASAKLALADVSAQHGRIPGQENMTDNSPYKPVPLIGDLDYYGKNNNTMVSYTRSYMENFQERLARMNTPLRGGHSFPIIDKVMDKYKMPRELKYLAVIESALNPGAVSPVGAVGPWQFMAATARNMGLTVSRHHDDRKDWYKSTNAACKYLNYLYDEFDDWLLVIAAYNSGPRPVMNAIARTGKSDFWSIKKYLPKETQNHVMAFVATATIMERLDKYLDSGLPDNFDWASLNNNISKGGGMTREQPKNPLLAKFGEDELKKMAVIRITSLVDLDFLCNVLHADRRQVGRWNYDYYDYMDNYKKGATYNLRIPKDKLDTFIEKKDYIERESAKINLQ